MTITVYNECGQDIHVEIWGPGGFLWMGWDRKGTKKLKHGDAWLQKEHPRDIVICEKPGEKSFKISNTKHNGPITVARGGGRGHAYYFCLPDAITPTTKPDYGSKPSGNYALTAGQSIEVGAFNSAVEKSNGAVNALGGTAALAYGKIAGALESAKKCMHSKGVRAKLERIPDEPMTRERYAWFLEKVGIKKEGDDTHVFHIICNADGGADHPDNFLIALGADFNKRIADKFDELNCYIAGLEKTKRAITASMRFGNQLDPRNGKAVAAYKPQHSQEVAEEAAFLFEKGQALVTRMQDEKNKSEGREKREFYAQPKSKKARK